MKNLIFILVFFLTACATTEYIEVPKEAVKVEYRDKVKYDSIYIKDSIGTIIKNDTVFITKYKHRYKTKIERDTVLKTDTLINTQIVTQEVVKEVNKLKNWQVVLMIMGGVSIGLLLYKVKNKILK